jgi:FtsP/CotA-like multicopper oxidase with cupredoxin domain
MAAFAFVTPAAAQDEVTIDLSEIDGSGISGTATLTDTDDGVQVSIEVSGDGVVGDHPAHIHNGTCDELDPNPEYSLTDIDAEGFSDTVVPDLTVADLLAAPYAINLHLSVSEIGTYVACGNIAAAGGEEEAAQEETATQEEAAVTEVTVDLAALNDSGVSGTATLTANADGGTDVSIEVSGDGVTGAHPAHIHQGTCDDLDPNPLYPLTDVDADGISVTTVDVTLDELLAAPYAINLHQSQEEIGVYIACGNIVAPAGGATDSGATTAPATGVGTAFGGNSGNGLLLAGLGAAAFVLAGSVLVLRRREVRA